MGHLTAGTKIRATYGSSCEQGKKYFIEVKNQTKVTIIEKIMLKIASVMWKKVQGKIR